MYTQNPISILLSCSPTSHVQCLVNDKLRFQICVSPQQRPDEKKILVSTPQRCSGGTPTTEPLLCPFPSAPITGAIFLSSPMPFPQVPQYLHDSASVGENLLMHKEGDIRGTCSYSCQPHNVGRSLVMINTRAIDFMSRPQKLLSGVNANMS